MTRDELLAEVNRIIAHKSKLPGDQQLSYIKSEIGKIEDRKERDICETLVFGVTEAMGAQALISAREERREARKHVNMTIDKILAFTFGVIFVLFMVFIALYFPNPTQSQWFTFRVVLALAAAGVGAVLPGLISVEAGPYVRAGGALALFVIVFWFNPPKLVTSNPKPTLNIPSLGKPYNMVATVTASGDKIERRTVPHPTSTGPDHHFYIDSESGNVNSHSDICPTFDSGWDADADPFPGFSYAMTDRDHVVATGDKYWSVSALPAGCIRIYCDGRNGSSHVQIAQVFVREKRRTPVETCGAPLKQESVIHPGELKQLSFDVATAINGCNEPVLRARVQLFDAAGVSILARDLTVGKPEDILEGFVHLSFNGSGLLDVEYRTLAAGLMH